MEDTKPVFGTAEGPPIPVLEEYIHQHLSKFMDNGKRASILLACIGEKPGEVAKFMDESRAERFKEFLDKADLNYITRSKGYYHKYYFSINKMFLNLLEKNNQAGFTQESVARFRGVPKVRVENPGNTENLGPEEEIRIENEKEHLTMLSGITPQNIEEKRQAFKQGRRREEIIRQFDSKNNTDIGKRILKQLQKSS